MFRRWLTAVIAIALLLVAAGVLPSLFSKYRIDAADQRLMEITKGNGLVCVLSIKDFINGGRISVQLPGRVNDDLKALILGPRSDMDPRGLRASEPLGLIDVSSDKGTHRLEWHVDIIVDPRGDISRIWSGHGPVAMSNAVIGDQNARVTEAAEAWNRSIEGRSSEAVKFLSRESKR